MKPWEYLDNLVSMDRGPEHSAAWMDRRMKERWPGNYTVIKYRGDQIEGYWRYRIAFNDPKEETMFRLKYS